MLTEFDIAIVGGGPAGLSAALWAGRCRRSVVVFDEGFPRNQSAVATHGYLGLDGQSPQQLLEHARSNVAAYPEVLVRSGATVHSIEFFGSSVFICASCDGYEAQGKAVAVMGDNVRRRRLRSGRHDPRP